MNEYISKKAVIKAIRNDELKGMWRNFETKEDAESFEKEIKSIPIADVRENIHGHWIRAEKGITAGTFSYLFKCSCCNYELYDDEFNFCPNCGCKMDGEPKAKAKVEIKGEPISKTIAEIPKEPKINLCDTCSRTECSERAFGSMICTICAMREPKGEKTR